MTPEEAANYNTNYEDTLVRWKHGQQAQLAREAGISPSYLCDILHRRRKPGGEKLRRLLDACRKLDIPLTASDLIWPEESKNPLMFPW